MANRIKSWVGQRFQARDIILAAVVTVATVLIIAIFYKFCFVGLQSRNAIDIAQIAANISDGNGFSTRYVRPSNVVYFNEPGRYYPELNSGPIYPILVALLFSVRSVSEQAVAWTSIAFFLLTLAGVYVLGKMLFDRRIGLLATGLFALSLPVLDTAISGEQWTLCAFLFTSLLIAMAAHHAAAHSGSLLKVITLAVVSAGHPTAEQQQTDYEQCPEFHNKPPYLNTGHMIAYGDGRLPHRVSYS